jgi:hypothetical protein
MGKYPNSDIHAKYSDWHWQIINIDERYKQLYVADIDRLWIEYDFKREAIVGVIDVKYEDSCDTITATENGIYKWFNSKGVRVFIVFITRDFRTFRIVNEKGSDLKLNEIEYAEFLLALRDDEKYKQFINSILSKNTPEPNPEFEPYQSIIQFP